MEVKDQKKRLKTPIKFDIYLNEEQKAAKDLIYENPILALTGGAGSGKTTTAIQIALNMLFDKTVSKVFITRPTVISSKNELGFLPGDLDEKYKAFLVPIEQAITSNYSSDGGSYDKSKKIESLFKEKKIETLSIQHARGINIDNAILVVDEAQNITRNEALMLLTRIMPNSKIIFSGDLNQCDLLRDQDENGLARLIHLSNLSESIKHVALKSNYRDPIVEFIEKNF
jgi:phosphate starvation-inducible PhoH-like protein